MIERKYLTGRKKYITKQNELYKYKATPVYFDHTDTIGIIRNELVYYALTTSGVDDKNKYIYMKFYSEPEGTWYVDYLSMPKKYIKRASISTLRNRITAEFEHSHDYIYKFESPSIKFVKLLKKGC